MFVLGILVGKDLNHSHDFLLRLILQNMLPRFFKKVYLISYMFVRKYDNIYVKNLMFCPIFKRPRAFGSGRFLVLQILFSAFFPNHSS